MSSLPEAHDHPSTPPSPTHTSSSPSPSPSLSRSSTSSSSPTYLHTTEGSDLPLLHRIHTTTGYRAGLSTGRDDPTSAQKGFDEGYPVGAALGMRAGFLIGAMEGLKGLGQGLGGGEVEEGLSLEKLLREMEEKGMLGKREEVGEEIVSRSQEEEGRVWEAGWEGGLECFRRWTKSVEELGSRAGVDLGYQGNATPV